MVKFMGVVAFAAVSSSALASGGIVETIPLGNLFDDAKGASIASAISSDTFGASAQITDLGVSKVYKGNLHLNAPITNSITFATAGFGGGSAMPSTLPTNDRVWSPTSAPISSTGTPLGPNGTSKVDDGVGLFGDMVISFDLSEIRSAALLDADQAFTFLAKGGINDYADASASLRVAVIVSNAAGVISGWINGQQVAVGQSGGLWSFASFAGAIPAPLTGNGQRLTDFVVPVPGDATQISLISVSLGDGNAQDQAIFGDARLTTLPVPAPGALALFGGGLLLAARRRRA